MPFESEGIQRRERWEGGRRGGGEGRRKERKEHVAEGEEEDMRLRCRTPLEGPVLVKVRERRGETRERRKKRKGSKGEVGKEELLLTNSV
jgi:hypothetical protein